MGQIEILPELLIIFIMSAVIVYLFDKIKIPSIVGFLISGVLLGPHGLSVIHEQRTVELLAEIGVALLLFTVGLEFSMTRIYQMGRTVFLGGGIQVLLTVAVVSVAVNPMIQHGGGP
jgi:CPA2 family monovalent cation:H+ antiporter-2